MTSTQKFGGIKIRKKVIEKVEAYRQELKEKIKGLRELGVPEADFLEAKLNKQLEPFFDKINTKARDKLESPDTAFKKASTETQSNVMSPMFPTKMPNKVGEIEEFKIVYSKDWRNKQQRHFQKQKKTQET